MLQLFCFDLKNLVFIKKSELFRKFDRSKIKKKYGRTKHVFTVKFQSLFLAK